MEQNYNIVNMNELGKAVNAVVYMDPVGDRVVEKIRWTLEPEKAALEAVKEMAKNGKPFRFELHPSKWLLVAMCRALEDNGVSMYIPKLDVEIPLKPFRVGAEDDGMSKFEIQEEGNTIYVNYTFEDISPVDMLRTVVPELPSGKDIVIRAVRHPILNAVCMALSYADTCRSVWVTPDIGDNYCVCAITNTPEYELGQQRQL